MSDRATIVIIGAGLAGFGVVQALREMRCADRLVLIGDEAGMPYDRPPLSKDVLVAGEADAAIELCTAEALAELDAELVHAVVVAIERTEKRVRLADGGALSYDRLVIATGGGARVLPGLAPDSRVIFSLRDRPDALALAVAMRDAGSLLIVGAGLIGLEVASVARDVGLRVTVVDNAPRPCARLVPGEVGGWLEALHRDAGVDFRFGKDCAVRREGSRIVLDDAETFDLMLGAVGMVARDDLARAAGLDCARGIVTDECCRTNDSAIFAVGDAARRWCGEQLGHVSLQSWKGAVNDARVCAAVLAGQSIPLPEAPWFWSEQRGHMIQATGWLEPGAQLISHEDGDRPLWKYGRDGKVTFVVGVDRNRDLRMAHRQLSQDFAASLQARVAQ